MFVKVIVRRCRRCGGKGKMFKHEVYNEYRVKCDDCGFMTTPYISGDAMRARNDAIKEWEERNRK